MRIFARILRQEARYSCCLDGVRDIAELHAQVHLLRVCGLGVQTLVSGSISCKMSDFEQVAVTSSSIKSGGSIYVSVLLWNLIYICMLSRFSHISFFATLWTVARLAPVSMGFSRQEYWSEFHFLLQGIFPNKRSNVCLLSLMHAGGFFTHWVTWEAPWNIYSNLHITYIKLIDIYIRLMYMCVYIHTDTHIYSFKCSLIIVVVQSLSCVQLFATLWTAARQASLCFSISWSLLRLMFIELVMLSNHFILCCPLQPCHQSFPASGSFAMSQLFASGSQT